MASQRKQKKRLYAGAMSTLKAKNVEAATQPDAIPDSITETLTALATNFESTLKNELSRLDLSSIPPAELINTIAEGISEGVTQELRDTGIPEDEVKSLAKEFILGLKEGMRDELEVIARENSTVFKETITTIKEVIAGGTAATSGTVSIKDAVEDLVESSNNLATATINIEQAPMASGTMPIDFRAKADELIRGAREKPRSKTRYTPYTFLRSVALESIGLEKVSEAKLDEEAKKTAFVEARLSQDPTASKKDLGKEYDARMSMVAELEETSSKLEDIKSTGAFTEDQIAKMPASQRRNDIVNALSSGSSSVAEEAEAEKARIAEQVLHVEEEENVVLHEIRDLISDGNEADAAANKQLLEALTAAAAASVQGGESSGLPDVDIDFPGKRKPIGKGGIGKTLGNLAKSAIRGISTIGRFALTTPVGLGLAAAGSIAYAGYSTYKDKEEYHELASRAEEAKRTNNLDLLSNEEWVRYQTLSEEFGDLEPATNGNLESLNAKDVEAKSKPIPQSIAAPSDNSYSAVADQIGKSITIQAPPPVVIPAPPAPTNIQLMPTPFTNGIRNGESTISKYIQSKY